MKLPIIKSIFVLSLIVSGIAGCLKDKPYDNHEIQSTKPADGQPQVIELKVAATNLTGFATLAYPNGNNDTVVNLVPVNLATGSPASEDIKVTIGLKPSLVNDYNNANSTAYNIPTASMFTLVDSVVTIQKGQHTGYLQIKMKPSDFIGKDWALGFVINSIDKQGYEISSNFNWAVIAIATKNQYDGQYHASGYFQHPSSPRAIEQDEPLKTFGPNTVTKALGDLSVNINITVNPDNTVTIGPAPGNTGSSAAVSVVPGDPVYNNTYDPATKTFKLKYGYPMPTPTRVITEKVVYMKSR